MRSVVSYRNSTSNHNSASSARCMVVLYLIEIPHQTTTAPYWLSSSACCILSKFHIKPQQGKTAWQAGFRCILSKFHIKPQQVTPRPVYALRCILSKFHIKPQRHEDAKRQTAVVSYRNSTSNHNIATAAPSRGVVVSYRNSTSNHNPNGWRSCGKTVVSYRNSTSNHNSQN